MKLEMIEDEKLKVMMISMVPRDVGKRVDPF